MSAHSAVVGGSSAGRLLNCPGSHQAIAALPPVVAITSEYAEHGTAMHEVMATLMRERTLDTYDQMRRRARALVGQRFHDRELSPEDCDTLIIPAIDALEELERRYQGGPFRVARVEARLEFPGVAGAFGTIDLLLTNDRYVLHVDWKFGAGVGVRAIAPAPDGAGDLVNPQLLFYAVAGRASVPALYKSRALVLAIIQPAAAEPLTEVQVDAAELTHFRQDVAAAVKLARQPNAPRSRGEHCRFAACKVTCPLWTGPLLDFTSLGPRIPAVPAAPAPANEQPTDYGVFLSAAKTLADQAYLYKAEIDAQLHAYLTAGGVVPGWKLKPKVKQRQWADDLVVSKTLYDLGFKIDEIWQKKLLTFARAEAIARARAVKIPDNLRVVPPSTETTIAREDDPAASPATPVAPGAFAAALNTLIDNRK